MWVEEEGEIFRKGQALLEPEDLESEYAGEQLRIEVSLAIYLSTSLILLVVGGSSRTSSTAPDHRGRAWRRIRTFRGASRDCLTSFDITNHISHTTMVIQRQDKFVRHCLGAHDPFIRKVTSLFTCIYNHGDIQ